MIYHHLSRVDVMAEAHIPRNSSIHIVSYRVIWMTTSAVCPGCTGSGVPDPISARFPAAVPFSAVLRCVKKVEKSGVVEGDTGMPDGHVWNTLKELFCLAYNAEQE